MFVLKRNQVIITALVVMIAVAGYLNYMDNRPVETPGYTLTDQGEISALIPNVEVYPAFAFPEEEVLGDALIVDENPEIAVTNDNDYLTEPGEAVFVNTSSDSSYFVQAKLNREQARAAERDILNGIINNDNVDAAQKAAAADSMLDIQRRIERESAAEAMIESKGFSEVYVRIDDNGVDVVVNKEALTDAEIAQIEDIIKRKTGFESRQIHISPMRR